MKREESIFAEALEQGSPAERAAYLDAACAGDEALRHGVETLLAAHRSVGGILESPPAGAGLALPDPAPSHGVGSSIGPYKLLEQIGGGGMGVVYMAEQLRPVRRKVALKIIKPGMDSGQVIARFEAERQALTMMDHPNIAKVLDAGTTDAGRPYFVMELVKGVPITDYCDQARLTTRERLELFVQVCHAVQHAHQKGVIHRDLKPTNVLVTLHDDKPVPKVIDFGIAKAAGQVLTDKTLFTNYAQMLGTPLYMSPEQAQLSGLDVDTRSDVYSLGVLLYELLTGTTPFDKQRLREAAYDEMRRIIREEEPPKPSTRLSSMVDRIASVSAQRHTEPKKLSQLVHGDLDWIAMKALEKDRTRRYETANGLGRDVERYLGDEAVQACPPSAGYRFRKFARRNKRGLAAATLLSLVLLLGSVVSTWLALRARRAESLAQARLVSETDANAKATAISGLLQEALESADPDRTTKGTEYTVRQLLDDLSQRLSNRMAEQPEAAAAIHATIGNAYRNLLQVQDAEPHLRKALELRRRVLGPDHPDVAQSLLDHSFNFFERGDRQSAEAGARETLAIFGRANVKDERVFPAYAHLVMYLLHQGKDAEAQALADRAFVVAEEAGYTEHRLLAKILHDLVPARTRAGDLAGAEELARRAVAMHGRVSGRDHPETGWAHLYLAETLEKRGKLADAETTWREALRVFRGRFEDSHKSITISLTGFQRILTAKSDAAGLAALRADHAARLLKLLERDASNLQARTKLGDVQCELGDLDGALATYAPVLKAALERPAPELKAGLADRYARLARLLGSKQKVAQAEAAFRQALSLREPLDGAPPAVRLAQAQDYNDLALVLKAPQRIDEAERAIRTAVELKQALVSEFPDNREYRVQLAHSYMGLGRITESAGQASDSTKAMAKAAEIAGTLRGEAPAAAEVRVLVARTLWQRADASLRADRLGEAEQLNREAMKTFQDLAADFPKSAFYRQEQAATHRKLADVAERAQLAEDAAQHLGDALTEYRKLAAEFPATPLYRQEAAHTLRTLAATCLRNRRHAEAEALLLPELELPAGAAAWEVSHFSEVVVQVLALYREWGKPAKVDEWQARALKVLDQAIIDSPRNVQVRLLRGRLLDLSAQYQQAVAEYSTLIDMAPELAEAWSGRGYAQLHLGQLERSVADSSKAIELNPHLHGAWFHRGIANIHLKQWDKAAADFDGVVRQWPQDHESRYLRAVVHTQLRRPDEAMADLREAVAKGFKDAERIKADGALEPLRNRDDFKQLIADLAARK